MSTWTLHRGEALSVLTGLPDGCVDAVITDPPYNSGGVGAARTSSTARQKYVSSDAKHTLADFDGENRDQRSYLAWMTMLLGQCYRLTRSGGPLLVFTDWRQLPITSDALQAAGWTWRGVVPWHKPNSRPAKGGFRRACEYILWATRGPVDAARNPVYLPGLMSVSQPSGSKRVHITQKPLELMRELVQICAPGGTVLDPFAGSGSTGVAALESGREFVGVEMSEHYHRVAHERLSRTIQHMRSQEELADPRPHQQLSI
ncbi:DNA-methyltransferase [Streptomyces alkaliterrae]|uniref:Methyltransferase n=1 Tax=Streptomyces alkaliterrae TaxID=2213162 RepID=A0A5P0YJZ4_9ACTN|nr:site-specific DNA-methyltransferase [Streptomyces alkaliterrae]MBB1258323.1 site-specific DNA-methyltransferase [Streptomyces alkaliterrae]MQS00694.1 site-specific DNA-methyltransferase [Streptomyces alkaliterrae]